MALNYRVTITLALIHTINDSYLCLALVYNGEFECWSEATSLASPLLVAVTCCSSKPDGRRVVMVLLLAPLPLVEEKHCCLDHNLEVYDTGAAYDRIFIISIMMGRSFPTYTSSTANSHTNTSFGVSQVLARCLYDIIVWLLVSLLTLVFF